MVCWSFVAYIQRKNNIMPTREKAVRPNALNRYILRITKDEALEPITLNRYNLLKTLFFIPILYHEEIPLRAVNYKEQDAKTATGINYFLRNNKEENNE